MGPNASSEDKMPLDTRTPSSSYRKSNKVPGPRLNDLTEIGISVPSSLEKGGRIEMVRTRVFRTG